MHRLLGHPNARSTTKLALVSATEPDESSDQPVVFATLTYSELYDMVNLVANTLIKLGIKPGDRVASFSVSNQETIVAVLAAIAIGAVYSSAPVEFGAANVLDRFIQVCICSISLARC